MTTRAALRDTLGRSVRPGRLLGQGGEGSVHLVEGRPGEVVKLYTGPVPAPQARRLEVMGRLVTPELLDVCAWPLGPVVNERGATVGLLMPEVPHASFRPLHDLTVQKSRLAHFPHADWRFLVRAARNLAGAVATIHAHGHVIGDLNLGNVLVTRHATVKLIDCDSFRVEADGEVFGCGVGVEAFTPPELQGADLRAADRTAAHDRFGLASLVFLLLMLGRYPFAGVWPGEPPAMGEAIRAHAYAYGRHAVRRGVRPPPGTLPVRALPAPLRDLFERAFGPRHTSRPTALEWVRALERLERDLVTCDLSASHIHARHANCPWCTLEAELDTRLFREAPPPPDPREREAVALWAAVETVSRPAPPAPPRLPDDTRVRQAVRTARLVSQVLGLVLVLGALLAWGYVLLGMSGVLALAAPGVALFVAPQFPSLWVRPRAVMDRRVRAARGKLEAVSARRAYSVALGRLRAQHDALRRLPADEREERAATRRRHAARLARQALRRVPLRSAPGLDSSVLARLSDGGLHVALDLTYERLRAIPELPAATVTDLLHWRLTLERGVVPDARYPALLLGEVWLSCRVAWRRVWLRVALRRGPTLLRGHVRWGSVRERLALRQVEWLLIVLAWLEELSLR